MVVDVVLPAVLGLVHIGEPSIDACNRADQIRERKRKRKKRFSSRTRHLEALGAGEEEAYRLRETLVSTVFCIIHEHGVAAAGPSYP